jgi:cellulose synthase/poly-beta-1,6-N-acetylglucosamine synthase-like glycosyltransferase
MSNVTADRKHHGSSTGNGIQWENVDLSLKLFAAGLFVLYIVFTAPCIQSGLTCTVISSFAVISQLVMGVYGLNAFFLLYKFMTSAKSTGEAEISMERFQKKGIEWPAVTVQLPIFNERHVAERLIKHCCLIDYPADRLRIQVLDDSTDVTCELVARLVEDLQADPKIKFKVEHLTRKSRTNFKAGALAQGTAQTDSEFLAIFDADFLPDADFLRKTIPRFYEDAKVGCVQCRWGHLNYNHSTLTKLQAIGHDGHFVVEQFSKCRSGFLFNFNGTAGVWRRQCIIDAGDWSGDTLAEDLDLSYRAQLAGWKMDYLRDVVVDAELPLSISAFKKQQARWAKGSMQTAIKLSRRVLSSPNIGALTKLEAIIHLFGYSVHLCMMTNLVVTLLLVMGTDCELPVVYKITAFVAAGPPLIVVASQAYIGNLKSVIFMPLLILFHHGLCISNASAVMEAIKGKKGSFERTPKFGSQQSGKEWTATSYARNLKKVAWPWSEALMSAILLVSLIYCDNIHTFFWLLFFLSGFIMVIYLHLDERKQLDAMTKSRATGASAISAAAKKKS